VSRRHGGEKFALGMRIVSSEDAREGAARQMSPFVSGSAHTDSGQPSSPSTAQPREVMNVAVLAESELGSEAQRERRKRILDATTAIASKGGYEAVQMRAVADRADVAVGTLYRYFPSKVHLLVSALGREFERIDAKTDRSTLTGATSRQRLNFVVSRLNRAMQRNPLLTEAMTRAYVFADASAAGEVDYVEKLIDSMFARAMSDGEPTEDQYHIARVISDVWTSNLLAWLTRRASATDVSKRLELAVRLLIGNGEHSEV
jgi:TetR/AcrR family transcriptional regulator, cholesterol catabolism regulator